MTTVTIKKRIDRRALNADLLSVRAPAPKLKVKAASESKSPKLKKPAKPKKASNQSRQPTESGSLRKQPRIRGITCPLCGQKVPHGQVLGHRVQVHGESATVVKGVADPNHRTQTDKKYLKNSKNEVGTFRHPSLISQLHKSAHKRAKDARLVGDQTYHEPKGSKSRG